MPITSNEQPVEPNSKHRYFLYLDEKLQYEESRKSNKRISAYEDNVAKQQQMAKNKCIVGHLH